MLVTLGYLAGFILGNWAAFILGVLAHLWLGEGRRDWDLDAIITGLICAAFFSCGYVVWMAP